MTLYSTKETSQKVTHPITTSSQAHLTVKFLCNRLSKSICIFLLYSHIPAQPFDPSHSSVTRSGYYMLTTFRLVHPRITLVLCSYPHAFWEISQKVTLPITSSSQTHLTVKFLRNRLSKTRCILLV
ncbi:hypothetical protein GmHk_20G056739 [Glycine max]|nr:hypothetical protein GmHk_20G056739 [Glycine max]